MDTETQKKIEKTFLELEKEHQRSLSDFEKRLVSATLSNLRIGKLFLGIVCFQAFTFVSLVYLMIKK